MALDYKSLQNPDQFGLGNDYMQDETYIVPSAVNKAGKVVSTYRDGIYTKLQQDVKDPEGLNKRVVVVPQEKWTTKPDNITDAQWASLSGETDGKELFTAEYATGSAFGYPFGQTPETYYTEEVADNAPTGVDVADFRQTLTEDEATDAEEAKYDDDKKRK